MGWTPRLRYRRFSSSSVERSKGSRYGYSALHHRWTLTLGHHDEHLRGQAVAVHTVRRAASQGLLAE